MTTLQINTSSPDVLTLQKDLAQLNYKIACDGVFGPETQATVIQFQHDHNLEADGIVGPNTWAVITDLLGAPKIYGMDVSHFNGTIDWNLVPASQIQFVYCKASQGTGFRDNMFATYMAALANLNYRRGAYHFYSFSNAPIPDQVSNYLGCGLDFKAKGVMPPVVDVEWQSSASLNQYIADNKTTCIAQLRQWVDSVAQQTGRQPMIYTAASFWNQYIGNDAILSQCPLWIADYNANGPAIPQGWNNFTIWQFSASATVPGINGNVDKDIFGGTLAQLNAMAGM